MSVSTKSVIAATAAVAVGAHSVYPFWYRDIQSIRETKRLENAVRKCIDSKTYTVDLFEQTVDKNPYKTFIIYNDTLYSYHDIDVMANKMSHFALGQGLNCGDTVALFMHNEPAFVWAWLGLAKIGIKCAFINYNLRGDSLLHCINVADAKVLVVGSGEDLVKAAGEVEDKLCAAQIGIWSIGNEIRETHRHISYIDEQLDENYDIRPSADLRSSVGPNDTLLYIFTSGTTGLPKATRYPNIRYIINSYRLMPYIGQSDVLYIPTPLYHGVAFGLGLNNTIRSGATCVIPRKFSVRHFWEDCRKHNVTVFFYVGELCRYLLAAPERPEDKLNKVRYMVGNGLQADIWSKFLSRFHIPNIVEFYGATDIPFFIMNTDTGTPGVVGKLSPLLKNRMSVELVKCDYETASPIRDSEGRCIPVKCGEPGLLLAKQSNLRRFPGYHGNEKQTIKKVIRNVLQDGDTYINSGDLMMLDNNYHLYFIDRLGDTFRWQGENVSTTEIAQLLTLHPLIQEATVYGVSVPGHNGRAGMAAVVLKVDYRDFDFHQLYSYLRSKLPSYACPRFIRIRQSLDKTGTFKYTKRQLMKEGFDPAIVSDVIIWMDNKMQTYRVLDGEAYKNIIVGTSRL